MKVNQEFLKMFNGKDSNFVDKDILSFVFSEEMNAFETKEEFLEQESVIFKFEEVNLHVNLDTYFRNIVIGSGLDKKIINVSVISLEILEKDLNEEFLM